ncbi:DEAD/DEAH box helicase family protein [Leptolyngbya sp. AN10]
MITSQGFVTSKPIPTKKSNPCPVCDNFSGKCRTFNDKPLVLCMGADSAPGWKNLGFDRSGLWQQFIPDAETKFDRAEWQQRKREPQPVEVPQTMSVEERDRFYRDWLAKGSLNERDRADLQRRGITDFSIAVSSPIGYAFPFKGLDGHYVGAQWRLAECEDGGRYRWHNLEGGKYFPGTNELPIAVYPVDSPKGIALAEGTGVKPLLASKRLGMITIGAAAGNHIASPTQLKAVFEAFPDLSVVIVPDAGDILNRHVMGRYDRAIQELRQWGIEPKFLWWEQRTKEQNDIDEATQAEIESAQSLTWEEFETLTDFKPNQNQAEQAEQSQRDRLINKRVFRFRHFWNNLQRDFLLPSIVNGNEIRWQTYQGFAPTIDLFWDTTCLQGWLGAGKTEAMLRSLIPFKDKAIVWVAPRNGLLRQTAQRAKRLGFNVYHYQDDPGTHRSILEAGEAGIYFMAPDSFKPYAVSKVEWENTILVIDEFSGIRKEILGKTTELPQVTDAIARCASLLVADAFLSQIDIRVIQKHRSGSMQILKQEFKKSSVRIKWLECRNKSGDISFSHEGIYYSLLDRWIEEGLKRIAIAVDSIHIAKMLDRYLKSKGVKTWIVCSETPQENHTFMPDPDSVIEHGRIQAVIYTPTAQSGLDIQAKFDRGLLICTGTLAPTQMLQMLGRCRQCPEWYVSAPRHSGNPECVTPSLDGKKIQHWAQQIAQTFTDLGFNVPIEAQGWAVWEDCICDIEKAFTSEYVRHLLDHFFESVEVLEVESDRVSRWRKDAQILKSEDAERTLKANLENGYRLIDEEKQPTLNSEVWDIKLAQFHTKYPRIANKAIADIGVEEFAPDAIEMTKLFQSRRVEKLKNYVRATEPNEQDDRDLFQYLQERPTHYNAGSFKTMRNLQLFRSLNLGALASVTDAKELEVDVNAYRAESPAITELYRRFQANPQLAKLFPTIDSQKAFFDHLKACMSYLGYEKGSKSMRAKTEELNPNGKDRKENQRFSKSKTFHFVFWLVMECSGSAYFRANLQLILEAIRDRLSTERDDRAKRREEKARYESPHPGWEAYAA